MVRCGRAISLVCFTLLYHGCFSVIRGLKLTGALLYVTLECGKRAQTRTLLAVQHALLVES